MSPENRNKLFIDNYDKIVDIIKKKRYKWILNNLSYIDYDDVIQKIVNHIYVKWDKYDTSKPLEPWINKIANNKLQNIYRDEYGYCAKPCIDCPANEGGDLCAVTKSNKQSSECDLYAKWEREKKSAHSIKTSVEYEESLHQSSSESEYIDFDKKADAIHKHMLSILTNSDKKIYYYSYVENLSVESIRDKMGYSKAKTNVRYIKQIQAKLSKAAVQEVKKGNVDI